MSDKAIIESRRFRTWDDSRPLEADHRIRLLIKAQYLRYRTNWIFWVLFGLGVIGAISALMNPFAELDWQGWVDGEFAAASYFGAAGPLVGITVLLIGSPTVSEDIRFNAPLFYFSRPVRVWDYVIAKVSFTFSVLALFIGMGLATTLLGTLLTIKASPPTREEYWDDGRYADIVASWEANAINSFGDWLFIALILITGTFSILLFLSTTIVAVSSFTRRAWHAAIGFIVLVGTTGMVGLGVGFVVARDSIAMIFGPFGWAAAVSANPVFAYYSPSDPEYLQNAPLAAVISHALLIGWSILAIKITHSRVTKMEGAL